MVYACRPSSISAGLCCVYGVCVVFIVLQRDNASWGLNTRLNLGGLLLCIECTVVTLLSLFKNVCHH